jgi:hypothetical protein
MGVQARRPAAVVELPLRLAWHARLRAEVAAVRRAGTEVLVIEPAGPMLRLFGTNPVNGQRIDEIEERAHELTVDLLAGRAAALVD